MALEQKMEGFLLDKWLAKKSMFKILRVINQTKKALGSTLKTEIHKTYEFSQIKEAIEYYESNMTSGKIILKPNEHPEIEQTTNG
jgi:hypothetical protein